MKRPWNLTNLPVYSLLTQDAHGNINMNICTYVSGISMKPKRFMIGIYENTKTLENIENNDFAILQLLSKQNLMDVRLLGKKSGKKVDKHSTLTKKKRISTWRKYSVLKDCAAILKLQKYKHLDAGDHQLYVFDVIEYSSLREDVLTLNDLRDSKIISI